MNIYGKLQQARIKLHAMPLKKSGINKYAGYEYFELGDFLPEIQTIFCDIGLCGVLDFKDAGLAQLHVFDTETDTPPVTFSTPVAEAGLKGCTPIQQVGAMNTYLTRYLWVQALCIVENDVVDAVAQDKRDTGIADTAFTNALLSCESFRQFLDTWDNGPAEIKQKQSTHATYKAKYKTFTKLQRIEGCNSEYEIGKHVTGVLSEPEQDAYNVKLDSLRGITAREI